MVLFLRFDQLIRALRPLAADLRDAEPITPELTCPNKA